jgi:pyruvate/2-oxoglutarate dehydrogenase complex dihydrolipoamide dehydrogenase (E3) component
MRGCARPTGASFAVGDVTGGPRSTHVANYHAGIVIRNALFRLPAKIDYRAFLWITYTDPEFAQVGLTEAAARVAGVGVRVLRWPFVENDRAQHEKEKYVQGMLTFALHRYGRSLGLGAVVTVRSRPETAPGRILLDATM